MKHEAPSPIRAKTGSKTDASNVTPRACSCFPNPSKFRRSTMHLLSGTDSQRRRAAKRKDPARVHALREGRARSEHRTNAEPVNGVFRRLKEASELSMAVLEPALCGLTKRSGLDIDAMSVVPMGHSLRSTDRAISSSPFSAPLDYIVGPCPSCPRAHVNLRQVLGPELEPKALELTASA